MSSNGLEIVEGIERVRKNTKRIEQITLDTKFEQQEVSEGDTSVDSMKDVGSENSAAGGSFVVVSGDTTANSAAGGAMLVVAETTTAEAATAAAVTAAAPATAEAATAAAATTAAPAATAAAPATTTATAAAASTIVAATAAAAASSRLSGGSVSTASLSSEANEPLFTLEVGDIVRWRGLGNVDVEDRVKRIYINPLRAGVKYLIRFATQVNVMSEPQQLTILKYPDQGPFHIGDKRLSIISGTSNYGPLNFFTFTEAWEDFRAIDSDIWAGSDATTVAWVTESDETDDDLDPKKMMRNLKKSLQTNIRCLMCMMRILVLYMVSQRYP